MFITLLTVVTLMGSWGYEFRHLHLAMGGLERTRERYDWALARAVQGDVQEKFGVVLEPEPRVV